MSSPPTSPTPRRIAGTALAALMAWAPVARGAAEQAPLDAPVAAFFEEHCLRCHGPKGHLVGYFDAPEDRATVIEFVDRMEPKTSISILPYSLADAR